MTTSREDLIAALEGEQPERIPFTIYHRGCVLANPDPAWEGLFAQGLCPVAFATVARRTTPNVERIVQAQTWRGGPAERVILRTPVGEISQLSARGWVQEYWLKTPADYAVMEYVVRDTRLEPHPQAFWDAEQGVGEYGIALIGAGRSPMQTILVDYAGLEAFSYHLADNFPELFALAEALLDQLIEECRLIAAGPGRYVELWENLAAEVWGPRRFAQVHLPVYERILPILHAGGKKVFTHFDGKLACLAGLIARTEIDGIESLTQPPEGDMSYAEARAAWPGKFLWGNINVSLYDLPPQALRRVVQQMARDAAPDGRLLAFEISEDLPRNWRESIPVVLEALAASGHR